MTGPGFHTLVVLLKLEHASRSPREMLKHKFLDPNPRATNLLGQAWDLDLAFLTSFQVMLMLLPHSPYLEEHCFRDLKGEKPVELAPSI